MTKSDHSITMLLGQYRKGNRRALNELFPLVYEQLRQIAKRQIFAANWRRTLSPSMLVHELYLRLETREPLLAENRAIFFIAAGQCMRRLLTDFARRKNAEKRGGKAFRVTLNEAVISGSETTVDLEALKDALERLSALDPELAQVVELRYLVGLSIKDTAEALNTSPMTIKRRWLTARAWLQRELGDEPQTIRRAASGG